MEDHELVMFCSVCYDTWLLGFGIFYFLNLFFILAFSRVVCNHDYFQKLQINIRITMKPL